MRKPLLVLDVKKLTLREQEDLYAAGYDVPRAVELLPPPGHGNHYVVTDWLTREGVKVVHGQEKA